MAMPRMAHSAPAAMSQQNGRLDHPMASKKERSYALSDLGKVLTRIEKFATREIIFSQGDVAETVMYIQKGRVEFAVASKTDKDAVVAILGPGNFFGEGSL